MKIKLTEQMLNISDFYKDFDKVYFVGGCIRDLIMGNEPHDYDLITAAEPNEIIEYIKSKGKRAYLTGAKFGTIQCKIGPDNEMTEITTFRRESYTDGSRKPQVEYSRHLEEDLSRRDFTINTLVSDTKGNVKDLKGGLVDLKNNILRAVGNPKIRFKEDPLRILRGIRFAAKYGFRIEEKTLEKLEHCRWELYKISKERIIEELNKIFLMESSQVFTALKTLWQLKMFQIILPELQLQYEFKQYSPHHDFDLHHHTMNVVVNVIKYNKDFSVGTLNAIWSALLHDIGKPFTQTWKDERHARYISHNRLGADLANDFCIKYKFSNTDRECIVDTVENHLKEDSWLKPFDDMSKKVLGENKEQHISEEKQDLKKMLSILNGME